jgi:4,4'-diaponeurosporenoate glycosyltransferase
MVAFFSRQPSRHTALSLLPFHVMERLYERLSLFFNLLMAMGAGGFGAIGSSRLFGQSLLIRKGTYQTSGGHESVRGNVLETFVLSSRIRSIGGKSVCLDGRGTLNVRMYPDGFWQLCQGWTKAFAAGAAGSEPAVLIVAVIWLAAIFATFLSLPIAPRTLLPFFAALFLICALQVAWCARQIGNFSRLSCALYPISLIFYFTVFGQSLYRRTFRQQAIWRGRKV